MRTIHDGHIYKLDTRLGNGTSGYAEPETIRFVNREPGHECDGTTTQEVIRALIDRTQYCDKCLPWSGNKQIVHHLRMALALHEARALIRKVERGDLQIELVSITGADHHLDIIEELPEPSYGFRQRQDTTDTGGVQPGVPCHAPVKAEPQIKQICGVRFIGGLCTLPHDHTGDHADETP